MRFRKGQSQGSHAALISGFFLRPQSWDVGGDSTGQSCLHSPKGEREVKGPSPGAQAFCLEGAGPLSTWSPHQAPPAQVAVTDLSGPLKNTCAQNSSAAPASNTGPGEEPGGASAQDLDKKEEGFHTSSDPRGPGSFWPSPCHTLL